MLTNSQQYTHLHTKEIHGEKICINLPCNWTIQKDVGKAPPFWACCTACRDATSFGSHFWLAMSAGRCESPKSRKSIVRFCGPTCKNAWIWGEINVKFPILRHRTYVVYKCLSLCHNPNCKSTPKVQARLVCGTPCWLPMTKLERKRIDVQSDKYARTLEMHWRSISTL